MEIKGYMVLCDGEEGFEQLSVQFSLGEYKEFIQYCRHQYKQGTFGRITPVALLDVDVECMKDG